MITEDQLEFQKIRDFSPQWNVSVNGESFARVTEKYLSTPQYLIVFLSSDYEESFDTRNEVIGSLLRHINSL